MKAVIELAISTILSTLLYAPEFALGAKDESDFYPPKPSGVARVVGGAPSSSGNYSFVANIVSLDPVFMGKKCSGTLINPRVVATTANCLLTSEFTWYNPDLMSVAVGGASENVYKVRQTFIADGYDRHTFGHNMGLIVLASPVPKSVATPVKIYPKPFDISVDTSVAGYGLTSARSGAYPSDVQAVPVIIQSNAECSYFADFNNATQLCAYGGRGKDVCGGDEGAPLLVTAESGETAMLGIASYTTGPAGVKGLDCGNGDRLVFFEMGGSWAKWISKVADIPYDDITNTEINLSTAHSSQEQIHSSSTVSGKGGVSNTVDDAADESKSITAFSANVGAIEGPSVQLGDSPASSADVSLANSTSTGTALALLAFTVFATFV
ncbi:hypothetical protein LPJ59_006043 [Coemansia sp. RSA 2399]|nr:hypothetical protein LPJ59_006043 [Coemansia sp. RSA 2399]KAJ1890228.1 hypothetical protein LPJ81_005977 [Coemansia sp. IMI 209127]